MTKIKNFFPEANIIQITTETHEIVVHRSKEGEVFVDVKEFATETETNLILGEDESFEDIAINYNDDLDGDPFAKK